ncbi:ArsC family reductase [Dasania sp. GY-MA-18]|uniref:ArsC family reductase n=1 Tax=Dasania phycosphaerae TaxID=2950436 RepID=A0A9J6RPB6_9GAMM|nr:MULTISPECIES: ArsC family reductase [Dasania]MCR8923961.1 ArsC family reductase [Dasania sp. GY-MA-18]MCZ0866395.1 ArsC family reductase [Dasania phycosphaerae]MCZ0870119.1 ArsC family reductase [Dasania phycosphaerae]
MVTLYGIKNCDSVKKARKWLEAHDIDYCFHDFRADGINAQQINSWLEALGWETLVNKRSTTWKQLSEATRLAMDAKLAAKQLLEQPTLIKRPLLDTGKAYRVGFKDSDYQQIFNS